MTIVSKPYRRIMSSSVSTSNEGVLGNQNQENICHLCTRPWVLNSTLSSSLQSVKHLWSYLYHRNVRETLVPLASNSNDGDLEIGGLPKLTFILSGGQQQEIIGLNHEHQLKICGNCLLHLEKLEKLHQDREAVDKLIQDQVKNLEKLLASQQNVNDTDLDSRKMRSFMRAPQLNLAFAGITVGKENISQALKFLNTVCDGMSSSGSSSPSTTPPAAPPPPLASTLVPMTSSVAVQGEPCSKDHQERSAKSTSELTEALHCIRTEVCDLPLDSGQPERKGDPECSLIVSGALAENASSEDSQQQKKEEPGSENEGCNGNNTQPLIFPPPPSPGVNTIHHQSPLVNSTEILRIKIEPLECPGKEMKSSGNEIDCAVSEMECPKESVQSKDTWLNDILEGKAPISDDCYYPAGLSTNPNKGKVCNKAFKLGSNRNLHNRGHNKSKTALVKKTPPILKFLNSSYKRISSASSTSIKSHPPSSCSTSITPPTQNTARIMDHRSESANINSEPLERSKSKECTRNQESSPPERFEKTSSATISPFTSLPTASFVSSSTEHNAGRPNVPPRGRRPKTSAWSNYLSKARCPICKVEFRSSDLRRHMMVHSGEKPFNCKFCNKAFAQTSNKNAHEQAHINNKRNFNNKPFKCDICNRGFSHQRSLKEHYRSSHSTDKDKTAK